VSVVVIDGVTLGHPCCGEPNCKIPLENNHHRFCPTHNSLNQQCAIIGCFSPAVSGKKTCSVPDHQAVERVHSDRGQARFQLKERLRRAQIAHPRDALPVEGVVDISELIEDANMDDNFTSNHKGGQLHVIYSNTSKLTFNHKGLFIPAENPVGKKSLRAQFGRKRTHNEQLFVAPCGMIIARETFFHAEAIYSVIVSFFFLVAIQLEI
jgi:hypothetical protein